MPLVIDPATGEEFTQEELDYYNQLRVSIAEEQLEAVPRDDGSWVFRAKPEGAIAEVGPSTTATRFEDARRTVTQKPEGFFVQEDDDAQEYGPFPEDEAFFYGSGRAEDDDEGVYLRRPMRELWQERQVRTRELERDLLRFETRRTTPNTPTVEQFEQQQQAKLTEVPPGIQKIKAVDKLKRMGLQKFGAFLAGLSYREIEPKNAVKFGGLAYGPERVEVTRRAPGYPQLAIHEGLHILDFHGISPEERLGLQEQMRALLEEDTQDKNLPNSVRLAAADVLARNDHGHFITYFFDVRPEIPTGLMETFRRLEPKLTLTKPEDIDTPPSGTREDLMARAQDKLARMLAEDSEIQIDEYTPEQREAFDRQIYAQATRETGESDPAIQTAIYEALNAIDFKDRDLTVRFKQELLWHYREFRAGRAFDPDIGAKLPVTDRNAAWTKAVGLARDGVLGPIISEQNTAQMVALGASFLDPVGTLGRLALGEERYESLPVLPTVAEWLPILLAPQKGLLKDLLFGVLGVKGGTVFLGGVVAGEQLAQLTDVPEFPAELAGGLASILLFRRTGIGGRWLESAGPILRASWKR